MTDSFGTEGASLSTGAVQRLDQICDAFEQAWLAGERPPIEGYLARVAEADRPALFRELLGLERDYLTDRGEPPTADDYLRRFPQWEALIHEVFRVLAPPGVLTPLAPPPTARFPETTCLQEPMPRIPGYEVLGVLGRGGMGVVYRARQIDLNRPVALKMVRAPEGAGSEGLIRFLAEARVVARLQHPNVVQIFEVGQHEGLPYFSLELVPGGTLAEKLGGTPQEPRPAAEVVETIARVVQHVHQQGIIHRDLKPANVLLTADGTPKVTDFGLAKLLEDRPGLTGAGAVLGTPSYMAPEQAAARKEIGPAADVYALGAILYEMLTGRPPFRGPSAYDTLLQVLENEPVAPSRLQPKVPRDLETVCLKCLEKDPTRRYASAQELADDLRRYQEGRPVLARPVGLLERTWRWCRRRPKDAGLIAAAFLVLVLGTCASLWVARARQAAEVDRRDRQARATTEAERNLAEAALLWDQAKTTAVGNLQPWEQALAAARRAQVVMDTNAVEEATRQRVEQTLSGISEAKREAENRAAIAAEDERMKAALEQLAFSQMQMTTGHGAGYVWSLLGDDAYTKVFRGYHGIDLQRPDEAEARIRTSAIRPQLVAALDAWIPLRPDVEARRRLADLANRLAEPDEYRRQLRAALADHDQRRLQDLARRDLKALPPHVLFDVALELTNAQAFEEAVALLRPAQQRYPGDFGINFHLAYCLGEMLPPHLDEQTRFYTAAVALQPTNSMAHNSLGNALWKQGRKDEALAEYRTAQELDPGNTNALVNLGNGLTEQGKLDEAATRYQAALRSNPRDPITHNNLGMILWQQGKLDEALSEHRAAIQLEPRYAGAHYGLGWVLLHRGEFQEAVAAFEKARQLLAQADPRLPGWQSALQHAERLRQLAGQLDAVVEHRKQPAEGAETLDYAEVCLYLRHSAAARLFKDGFTAAPQRAEKNRFEAARAALRLGLGQCADANSSTETERAAWRTQARDWLRADLQAWARQAESASADDRRAAAQELRQWQLHVDLAAVRTEEALKTLPGDEQALWRRFWADVAALVDRAERP